MYLFILSSCFCRSLTAAEVAELYSLPKEAEILKSSPLAKTPAEAKSLLMLRNIGDKIAEQATVLKDSIFAAKIEVFDATDLLSSGHTFAEILAECITRRDSLSEEYLRLTNLTKEQCFSGGISGPHFSKDQLRSAHVRIFGFEYQG